MLPREPGCDRIASEECRAVRARRPTREGRGTDPHRVRELSHKKNARRCPKAKLGGLTHRTAHDRRLGGDVRTWVEDSRRGVRSSCMRAVLEIGECVMKRRTYS
jgi:hypothetical protein